MLSRLVIGYIVALAIVVPITARSWGGAPQQYTIAIALQSDKPGFLQVFYDTGRGFSEPQSAVSVLQPSDRSHEYQLLLPPGRYRAIRIDPGTVSGRYVIERISILAPGGSVHTAIPLLELKPAYQLSVREQTRDRLIVDAPPGANDPQLLYTPESPVVIPDRWFSAPALWFLGRMVLLWICATGAVWLIEARLRRFGSTLGLGATHAATLCDRYQRTAICLTAVLSTLVATYPILFLGRSFVAPNNNGTPLLYGEAPYAPGSTDVVLENIRGSDVWAGLLQEVPHSNVQREAIAHGEVPLWNRYNAGGRPLWGQGLTSVLDPLHWLTFVTPDPALGWDLKYIAHRIVFAQGTGLAALAATGAWLPAVVVAGASSFIGLFAFRLNHPAIFTVTYAPWVLLGWFMLAVAGNWRSRARAAMLLALSSALALVAGTPKEAVVMLLGLEAIGALTVLLSPGSWPERGSRLFVAALAGVIALLITAPHWLVFLETLTKSYTLYDKPYFQFARRREAIGFFLGPLAPGTVQPGLHLLGLVLTMAAVAAPRELLERRGVLACGIGAAVLIAIAFGALPPSTIVKIPLLGNIGHYSDVFLAAALPALLIVGAFGADTLLRSSGRRSTFVCVAVGAVSWWLWTNARSFSRNDSVESMVLLPLVPVAIAIPWCFHGVRSGAHRLLAVVATTMASLLLLLPGGLHAETSIPVLDDLLLQPRLRSELAKSSPAVDAIHRASTEPSRTVGVDWTLFAGSQAFYDLEGIGGADPLEVPTYRELVDAGGILRVTTWATMVRTPDVSRLGPLLDMLNVDFLIEPVSSPDRARVERRATAWPRAFFVDGVTTYVDAPDLMRKVEANGKPLAAVQSSDAQAVGATRSIPAVAANIIPAHAYKVTLNTTGFVVRASGPGIAVLGETFLPQDFRATLNGRRVPYFRVNHAFKAVVVPSAGEWVVRFEYRPEHWDLSLMMAGVGLVLLAGLGVSVGRPRYVVDTAAREKPAARASS